MVGGFGDPDLGFPRDLAEEGLHGFTGLEGGHEDEARRGTFEQLFQLRAAFAVHRAGAGDGFDEDEPVAFHVVDDDVGHLCGGLQNDSDSCEVGGVEVEELALGVAEVDHQATGSEDGREVFDDSFDEQAPAKSRGIENRAIREY